MKKLIVYILFLTAFMMAGCVIRTVPRDIDRVDQEVSGNRGYLKGGEGEVSNREKKKKRRIFDVEIEVPASYDDSGQKECSTQTKTEKVCSPAEKTVYQEKSVKETKLDSTKPQVVCQRYDTVSTGSKMVKEDKTYVVQKGDTLQKISSKFYGTTKKWKKIFKANKDKLKSPDKIKPGQTIVIPMK